MQLSCKRCQFGEISTPRAEKRGDGFIQHKLHNFHKCTHSLVIFGTNHSEDSFYEENRKFVSNIITWLRSDDVIVTSSEKTLSRIPPLEKLQQYSV